MKPILQGSAAFVTGATSGLGRHFANILAEAGASVAIAGRRVDRLANAQSEIETAGGKCAAIALDVTDAAAIPAALDEAEAALGPINILVNNAGMNVHRHGRRSSADADFDAVMNTNLRGPFLLAQRNRHAA